MSLENEQIKEQWAEFAGKYGPKVVLPATVTAVNDDDTIAIEFSDDSTVDDARLKSVVKDGNKMIMVPEVGSVVLVARIENSDEFIVVAVESVSEVLWIVGNSRYSMNEEGHLIKKGDDTLKQALVKFIEAVEVIIVMQGRNPDRVKLAQAKASIQNILR